MLAIIQRGLEPVANYYRQFSTDCSWAGDFVIGPQEITQGHYASFDQLLQLILNMIDQGAKELLIANHGHPDGIPLHVVPGTQLTANADILDELRQAADGDSDSRDGLLNTLDDRNIKVFRNAQQLDDLLDIIRRIRQAGLQRLELRSCNVGAGTALKAIHRLLNSKYTVAPKVFFVWSLHGFRTASIRWNGGAADSARATASTNFQARVNTMGFPQRLFTDDDCMMFDSAIPTSDIALALSATVQPNGRPGQVHLEAISQDAVLGWTKRYLEDSQYFPTGQRPAGGGYQRGGLLWLVGLWNPDGPKPIVFPGDGFDYLQLLAVEN
jgi:hypothetical protein